MGEWGGGDHSHSAYGTSNENMFLILAMSLEVRRAQPISVPIWTEERS